MVGEQSSNSARNLIVLIVVIGVLMIILMPSLINMPRTQTVTRTVSVTISQNIYHTMWRTVTLTETITKTERVTLAHTLKEQVIVDHEVINQPAGSCTVWMISLPNPGYLEVIVHSSTSTNTYAKVKYTAYGVNFDQEIKIGSSGTASFPILPTKARIYVCNSNLISGASHTVSIKYHYW